MNSLPRSRFAMRIRTILAIVAIAALVCAFVVRERRFRAQQAQLEAALAEARMSAQATHRLLLMLEYRTQVNEASDSLRRSKPIDPGEESETPRGDKDDQQ